MRYVLVMLGSLVGLVIVAYLLLYLLISVGCIYPANYAEQKINEAYDTILHADKVTAEMIPALCNYVIFFREGRGNRWKSSRTIRTDSMECCKVWNRIREIFL